ncbi:MAG: plasmid replication protein RepC [Sulfitobacter sp.]
MSYIPRTPFRRVVDAALVKHLTEAQQAASGTKVSKWDILRDISVAKQDYALSDRTLTVLQALLSFHPETDLADTGRPIIVFPSNAALCERLHGMPCSTMRRHLSRLIDAGLLLRRDSPNGKRYVKRRSAAPQAFGFDLGPLPRLASHLATRAAEIRAEQALLEEVRQTVVLMRRDLEAFVAYGRTEAPETLVWDSYCDLARLTARDLRRQLCLTELNDLKERLSHAIEVVEAALIRRETPQMSISAARNEQHCQNSDKEEDYAVLETKNQGPSFHRVLVLCTEIRGYATKEIKDWSDLRRAAEKIVPMMGIDPKTWFTAVNIMGSINATLTIAAMLQRFSAIRNPGAYLTHLTAKAKASDFSVGPMLRALERQSAEGSQL